MAMVNTDGASSCLKKNGELQVRIMFLEMKVQQLANQLEGLGEIKNKMKQEIQGYSTRDGNISKNSELETKVPQTSGSDMDHFEEHNKEDCKFLNDDKNSLDCTSKATSFLASDLDEPVPLDLSVPKIKNIFPGNSTIATTNSPFFEYDPNDPDNGFWKYLNEQVMLPNDLMSCKEQTDKQAEQQVNSSYQHESTQSDGNVIVCPYCSNGRTFKQNSSLARHIKTFHTENPGIYECVECKITYRHKGGLIYHFKSTHQGIRYVCQMAGCTRSYTTITKLRKHHKVTGHHGFLQTRKN